jgi:hypothetical protein
MARRKEKMVGRRKEIDTFFQLAIYNGDNAERKRNANFISVFSYPK